jgi:hypothetical protein
MSNEKTGGKSPIVSTLIAAFSIIVYIAALSYAALMIFDSVSARRTMAEEEFDRLTDRASAAGVLGFMNEPFVQAIQDEVDNSQTLLGVIISGPNGEYAFERERGTVISWVNNVPRFKTRFGTSYPPRHMPLRIEGQRNVNIQVISSNIDYDGSVRVLKRTLLAVLAALMLAFFTLLIETVLLKNRAPVYPAPQADISADQFTDIEDSINQEKEPLGPVLGTPIEPENVDAPLLDPAEERLEDELHGSTLAGKDLVYLVMGVKNTEPGEEAFYQAFIRSTLKFFTHRDLIFKKDNGLIAVICPDTGLEQGFTQAEDFYVYLQKGGLNDIPPEVDVRIGISSRAERPIGAERLMFEAEEALRRAEDDPVSHIVAFKSDPEKYRDFILARGQKAS